MVEWRVVRLHPRYGPVFQSVESEDEAKEWAADEREDYPHHVVTIECRVVGPWRVAGELKPV